MAYLRFVLKFVLTVVCLLLTDAAARADLVTQFRSVPPAPSAEF